MTSYYKQEMPTMKIKTCDSSQLHPEKAFHGFTSVPYDRKEKFYLLCFCPFESRLLRGGGSILLRHYSLLDDPQRHPIFYFLPCQMCSQTMSYHVGSVEVHSSEVVKELEEMGCHCTNHPGVSSSLSVRRPASVIC